MQQQTGVSVEERAGPAAPPRPDRPSLDAADKRHVFKRMVVGELEAGFLRYTRREALMKYATQLGIEEFEATLLIAEAQFHSDQLEPIHFSNVATFTTLTQSDEWSYPLRLVVAAVVAVALDLVVIYWLFG